MNLESVISERGQVTLPKDLRDRLGLKPGTVVSFVPSAEGLLLRKAPGQKPDFKSVLGVIRDGVATDHYLEKLRGKAE